MIFEMFGICDDLLLFAIPDLFLVVYIILDIGFFFLKWNAFLPCFETLFMMIIILILLMLVLLSKVFRYFSIRYLQCSICCKS